MAEHYLSRKCKGWADNNQTIPAVRYSRIIRLLFSCIPAVNEIPWLLNGGTEWANFRFVTILPEPSGPRSSQQISISRTTYWQISICSFFLAETFLSFSSFFHGKFWESRPAIHLPIGRLNVDARHNLHHRFVEGGKVVSQGRLPNNSSFKKGNWIHLTQIASIPCRKPILQGRFCRVGAPGFPNQLDLRLATDFSRNRSVRCPY